jgi:lipid II:glycine glycyltransferase (peptidoglycan interpeptide bridge formation enzyme)
MNARVVNQNEIETYNSYIAHAQKNHFLQSWEWGNLKEQTGWSAIRVIAEDRGVIVGALQLLSRKLPILNRTIIYAPRGPIIDNFDIDIMKEIIQATRKIAKETNAIFLRIDPDIRVDDITTVNRLREVGFVHRVQSKNFEGVQPRFVFRLSIEKDLEEIFGKFESKTRYNIRLAEKKGVVIVSECTKDDLATFYNILKVTAVRDRYVIRAYSYYESIWDIFVTTGKAKLFMAEYNGEYIAGALSFILGDKVWYIYGASSNEHRNVMPNYAVQWEMIKWAKSNGCTIYDFRGISGDFNPENPLYGLYRFKKGFNGDLIEFAGEFDLIYSPVYYHLWNNVEPLYKKLRHSIRRLKRILMRKKPSYQEAITDD